MTGLIKYVLNLTFNAGDARICIREGAGNKAGGPDGGRSTARNKMTRFNRSDQGGSGGGF